MLIAVVVGLIGLVVLVASFRPVGSELSDFELQRRVDDGDKDALKLWRRKDLYKLVVKLQWCLTLIIVVALGVVASMAFGVPSGVALAVAIGLWHHQPARLIHRLVQPQYRKYEANLLAFVEKARPFLKTIHITSPSVRPMRRAASRQELIHMFNQSTDLTSSTERSLMAGALRLERELVKDHMTSRGLISSVAAEEMIGPLVLDDLHKTGQRSFPVRDGDVDHIVGVLHIDDLVNLNNKTSATARDLMAQTVHYIDQDSTIAEALRVLAETQAAVLVVRDKESQTMGVFCLADAMAVLGNTET